MGDRLKHFITLNEPAVHTVFGHVLGEHAPGLKDIALPGPTTHHMNLGQGLAIQALRAAHGDLRIGTTQALQPCRPSGGALAFWNRPAADGPRRPVEPGLAGSAAEGDLSGADGRLPQGVTSATATLRPSASRSTSWASTTTPRPT